MKYIALLITVFLIHSFDAGAQVNNGRKWKVKQVEIIFRNNHTSLYHKDSTENLFNYDNLSFRFYGDGTYKKYLGNDSSFVGPWSLNPGSDSVRMDNIPFKLVKLDADSFTTRGYSLQLADGAGTIDTSFSYLRLYSVEEIALPVTLLSFTAAYNNNNVKLQWTTTSEINNHHFEVLRSRDGVNFVSAGTVAAGGSASLQHHYLLNDANYNEGINFYRLKQVDIDGRPTLSDIVVVTTPVKTSFAVNIYPNPAKDDIVIELPQKHEELTVSINNVHGQAIVTRVIPKDMGKFPVSLGGQARGIYQATIRNKKNEVLYSGKLLLQ